MKLQPGTRVRHEGGRLGTVERTLKGYYRVRFDEKANGFEPDLVRVYGRALTPVDPKLHAKYEAEWAKVPFVDRSWATKT
jgi:hypothetical protein